MKLEENGRDGEGNMCVRAFFGGGGLLVVVE